MAKSEKLYKDSPKIEKNDDGKPAVKKASKEDKTEKVKESDKESMGLSGSPLEGAGDGMPIDEKVEEMHSRHSRETKDMHKRHQDEQKDMHKRHLKEAGKLSGVSEEKDSE